MEPTEKVFVIVLMHSDTHNASPSYGKVRARDEAEAMQKAELWLARKKRRAGCYQSGHKCRVAVSDARASVRATILASGAEEIS